MNPEWLLFVVLLLAGLMPLLRKGKSLRVWAWTSVFMAGALSLLGGAIWQGGHQTVVISNAARFLHVPSESRKEGYVTSDQCQACHPNEYASWYQSFHRTMTQYASADTALANFDNIQLEARGETYSFQRKGNQLWVEMPDPDWKADQSSRTRNVDWSLLTNAPRVLKQVSMSTGSHHLQKFWVASGRGNLQYDLPFTYLIEDRRWVLREDSIVRDPKLPLLVQVWNVNCIKCHTTGAQPRRDPKTGILETRVGEMGIACEACHGPAEEHVKTQRPPLHRYQARLSKSDATIVNPANLPSKRGSQACGQCHAIKLTLDRDWEQNGSHFRPGGDLEKSMAIVLPAKGSSVPGLDEVLKDSEEVTHFFWRDGMVRIAGREYNGLVQSPCYERGELSCFSCHSLHKSDPDDQLASGMNGNQACLQCHSSFQNKIEQHTHHLTGSSGSLCYNCHMPHTTWGLLGAIRSHQISSPNVQASVKTGRPNGCNLCHLDKTLAWSAQKLSEWYRVPAPMLNDDEKTISAAVLWALKGDAAQRALIAWSMGWNAAQDISGHRWMVPILAQLSDDPYGAVRYRAGRALKRILGFETLAYDYVAPPKDRTAFRERVLEMWEKNPEKESNPARPEVLIGPNGGLNKEKFDQLVRQRDNRSVFIIE